MARPTKLTKEVRDRIVAAVRAGNYPEPSARAAGISPATYYRWLSRGEKAKSGIYHDFYEAIKRAEGEVEVEIVARLRKAIPDDHRVAVTFLERRYPTRWGRRNALEHTGADGAPLQLGEVIFGDPEARKAARALLIAAGAARAEQPGGTGNDD